MSEQKISIREVSVDGKTAIAAVTPYNADFISAARKLNGQWNRSQGAWLFDPLVKGQVVEAVRSVYGTDGTAPLVNIRLTALSDIREERSSVKFQGFPVCSATGRDSGAKPESGVMLVSGTMRSGGSHQYWKTVVEKGAEFVIRGIPKDAVDGYKGDGWKVEVLPDDSAEKRRSLTEERERLSARIAEIDALLAEMDKNGSV